MAYCSRQGRKIYYEYSGEGEAVVFLHSLGTSLNLWSEQYGLLKSEYRVIALDFNGHGESESAAPFTIADAALDVLKVLDDLSVEKAHLVGISMGGHIALELISLAPERVRSLFIGDTWAYMPQETVVERTKIRIGKLKELSLDEFQTEIAATSIAAGAHDQTIQQLKSCMKFTKEIYETAWHAVNSVDYRELLPSVQVPALVFVGDQDKGSPVPYAEEIAKGIPGGKLVIVPNGGHLAHVTNQPFMNEQLTQFLKGE
jgi:3-oxoadipate enol-lactonase